MAEEPGNRGNVLLEGEKIEPRVDIKAEDVISWTVSEAHSYRDGLLIVKVSLSTRDGFGLYSKGLVFSSPELSYGLEKTIPPSAQQVEDTLTGKMMAVYYSGEFELRFRVLHAQKDEKKPFFALAIRFVGCTNRICLFPYTQELKVAYDSIDTDLPSEGAGKLQAAVEGSGEIDEGTAVKETSSVQAGVHAGIAKNGGSVPEGADSAKNGGSVPEGEASSKVQFNGEEDQTGFVWEDTLINYFQDEQTGFFLLLLVLFLAGLLTNLTPCVYPMIPITIKVLAKQSKHPTRNALMYALGLVLVYTALGVAASLSGGLFGQYMANKSVNITLSVLMLVFALSMLGFGDFAFLQRWGLSLEKGSQGVSRAFWMGCAAAFVASPCTGPILAMLLTYIATAQGGFFLRSLLSLLVYSLGFAAPYALLGRLSSHFVQKKLPFFWQLNVKVGFAGVMVALAFYYARIPLRPYYKDLDLNWGLMAFSSFFLGLFIFLIAGVSKKWMNKTSLIVPALLLGASIFSFSQWIEHSSQTTAMTVRWIHNGEQRALAMGQRDNKPILIDMWAEWCESCKKMEVNTFQDKAFLREVVQQGWILLKLDLTEAGDYSDKIQQRYGIQSLPSVVLIPNPKQPDKTIILSGYVSAARLLNHMKIMERG